MLLRQSLLLSCAPRKPRANPMNAHIFTLVNTPPQTLKPELNQGQDTTQSSFTQSSSLFSCKTYQSGESAQCLQRHKHNTNQPWLRPGMQPAYCTKVCLNRLECSLTAPAKVNTLECSLIAQAKVCLNSLECSLTAPAKVC